MTQPTFVPSDNTATLDLNKVHTPPHSTIAHEWATHALNRHLTDRLHATATAITTLAKIQPRPLPVSSAGDPA